MKVIQFLLLTTCLFLFSACGGSGDNDVPVDYSFSIDESFLVQNLEKGQQTLSIPVKTNLETDKWSVSSDADWCVVATSINGQSITIVVKESTEAEVRTAKVSVTSTIKNYVINISQLGYGPAILLKANKQTIGVLGGSVEVKVTTNVDYDATLEQGIEWLSESKSKGRGLEEFTLKYNAESNPDYSTRSARIVFTDVREGKNEADKAKPATLELIQDGKEGNISDVVVEGDILITPTGGKASEHQNGYGIEHTYDGDTNPAKHYHSRWSGMTEFPVTLEYYFDDNEEDMDYLVYHTRNGNGNFGEFDLYLKKGNDADYQFYGSYDFKKQNAASRLDFAESQQAVKAVKFVVKTGAGDVQASYVSCAEMQFFRKNTEKELDAQLLTVFTDITCTELKEGVTEEAIQALPSYFGKLATVIRDNQYDEHEKEFRIQEYKPYSDPVEWAQKLMTKKYTMLDNPTGIHVEAGDEIILLVGDTHGNEISVQNVGEESAGDYVQTAASGTSNFLEEGVNKIVADKTGMLFIIYHTDLTSANAKPIKIHIPIDCGKVGGYFDLEVHKTNDKYKELIEKSTYKYFCVRGEKIMFYFHRDKMLKAVPYDMLSAINLWDDIIGWQQELMGIDDVRPSKVNNHIFAISPEGSYMWASDYRVAFVYTYLDNILLYDNVMANRDNAWGPAHEIGHIHQQAINWPSSTESSNNLFSNYVLYKLGKYCSRGEILSALAKARFVDGQAWYNMGDATHQNESTEIHMRMNWQLWNYYHRCGYKKDFWQTLFKLLREDRIVESNPGEGQLKFAMMACKAAKEDLTDFFEMWGFFEPVDNVTYSQYGTWNYNVTTAMIAEAKQYMSQFPKAKHAFYYLEDRKAGDVGLNVEPADVGYYTQFEEDQKITKKITHSRSGQNISISNGDEAVAFEVYNGNTRVYFSNMFSFTVPTSIKLNEYTKVYAVQADGERILVEDL